MIRQLPLAGFVAFSISLILRRLLDLDGVDGRVDSGYVRDAFCANAAPMEGCGLTQLWRSRPARWLTP